MTSDWLAEMFKGDSADTRGGKFPVMSMGGRAEGLACAEPGARTPLRERKFCILHIILSKPGKAETDFLSSN